MINLCTAYALKKKIFPYIPPNPLKKLITILKVEVGCSEKGKIIHNGTGAWGQRGEQ